MVILTNQIERLYSCSYPGCTKAYGTLNHLNAHITMQKHGPKRLPQGERKFCFQMGLDHALTVSVFTRQNSEFKEIRKEWRARKKAEAEARSSSYKHAHQPHKNQNAHHHQPHPQFQSHPNHRVLSTSSSASPLGPDSHTGNSMGLMGNHPNSSASYGNVPSRTHTLVTGGSNSGGNLMNIGQVPMGRVLSTGALENQSLTTNMMTTHHGYGSDLLSPLPSSAPAYYASSHYAPPPLGSPSHAHYMPGVASAPRHAPMKYPTQLRATTSLPADRNQVSSSDNARSVSGHGTSRNTHDLKQMMNEDSKSNNDQFLVTPTR